MLTIFSLEKVKEERQHVMFPDEVDTPVDVPARVRFARYLFSMNPLCWKIFSF